MAKKGWEREGREAKKKKKKRPPQSGYYRNTLLRPSSPFLF